MKPAKTLPVTHLSKSALSVYWSCPERFRRRYIEGERESVGVPLILGATVGAAIGANAQAKISTHEDWPLNDVVERFAGEWDERVAVDDIDWAGNRPGRAKDQGVALTTAYHTKLAPTVQPVSVERKMTFKFPDTDWDVQGYIDIEDDKGAVIDVKTKAKRYTATDLGTILDAPVYLAARRAEGNPASHLELHVLLKTATPGTEVVRVTRTDAQLDAFLRRIVQTSLEIEWRVATGNWQGAAPGSWLCSERFCGFWHTCPYGGAK